MGLNPVIFHVIKRKIMLAKFIFLWYTQKNGLRCHNKSKTLQKIIGCREYPRNIVLYCIYCNKLFIIYDEVPYLRRPWIF
jgi:uncharacterized protein YbaR (Trm112 family)